MRKTKIEKKWIYTAIIFCAVFLLYAKTIGFDLSYFDDDLIIINHSAFFERGIDIKKIFTTDAFLSEAGMLYRPLQTLSYAIDTQLAGGINPNMYHFTNVLLFALLVCSLFFLFRRFNIPDKISFIGTLLFVVHPMFTVSVSWIPARGDLLLTLFSILSVSFFIDFIRQQKYYQLVFSSLFFLLALFSKETAAFLPFIFLLYFFCFQEKPKIEKKHILFGIILLFAGLFWFYLRSFPISGDKIGFYYKHLLNVPTALSQLVVFPFDFSTLPLFTTAKIVIGSLLLIFLLYIVCRKDDEIPKKEKLFYILWFVLLLLPLFFHSQSSGFDYMDHRFLLPMVGIFALLLSAFPKKWINKKITKPVFIIVVAVLSIVSYAKSNVFKNAEELYGTAIKYDRKNSFAHYNRGVYRKKNNNIQGALDDFSNAIFYGHKNALLNRGVLKQEMGDLTGAMDDYNRIISYNNEDDLNYEALFNRGVSKQEMGDLTGAMDDFDRVISYFNEFVLGYNVRGILKIQMGDFSGAISDFDNVIKLENNNIDAYTNRSVAKGRMGNFNEAMNDINMALRIDSNNAEVYYSRAALYWYFSDNEKALQDCERVLKIEPEHKLANQLKNHILTNQ